MAKRSESELDRLRKTVASYVKGLIVLGLAAQTLSSSGGSYLAVSRLIGAGIALASRLQRGIVVRVVGAPLVRRRPRRRSRAEASEEYPEPSGSAAEGATARDQASTGWEEVVPPSLALAEIDSQPFSLARALPSIVAAQQSTFRALSSVNAAVSRAVGGAGFASSPSRAPPSLTALEQGQRPSPEAFPENQATSFAGGMPALAAGVAFRAAASSMAFNLSSAAHEMTNIALGSQAVGANFASQQPRAAKEGTGFLPASPAAPSPSLAQQSITGNVDTTFKGAQPSGANLGLVSSAGGASPPTTQAPAAPSAALPLTRESSGAPGLSAEVGGPAAGSQSGGVTAGTSSSGSGVELNAGPYTVPNGFNSVLASPPVAAASRLSMQVRSLAASASSGQLPIRASQEPSHSGSPTQALSVVPEQYPSTYPVGAAYSVSSLVASLGLGQTGRPEAPASAQEEAAARLTPEEAPGAEDATRTSRGAFVGEPLEARGAGIGGGPSSPEETALGGPQVYAEEGGAVASSSDARISNAQPVASRGEFASFAPVFGKRWLQSIAEAASIGGAMLGMLTGSAALPWDGTWIQKVGAEARPTLPSRSVSGQAIAPPSSAVGGGRILGRGAIVPEAQAAPEARATQLSSTVSGQPIAPSSSGVDGSRASGRRELIPEVEAAPAGTATSPSATPASTEVPRGTEWRDLAKREEDISPTSGRNVPARPQEPESSQAPHRQAGISTWEAATLLPGILTPSLSAALSAQAPPSPSASLDLNSRPAVSISTSGLGLEGETAPRQSFDALRLAASLRSALLGVSASLMGARTTLPAESAMKPTLRPQLAQYLEATAGRGPGTFVSTGASGVSRRVDSFELSRAQRAREAFQGPTEVASFATTNLAALQAAFVSRGLIPGGAVGRAGSAPSLTIEAAGGEGQKATPGTLAPASRSPLARRALGQSSAAPELSSRELEERAHATNAGRDHSASRGVSPTSERDLEAVLASLSREGRGNAEGVFFGLEAVAHALSLAARLPSAAQLNGALAPMPSRTRAPAKGTAPARQAAREGSSEVGFTAEPSRQSAEGWRSVPEESISRMLGEPSGRPTPPAQDAAVEPDDRELRRKIERIIDEDLRRYGYQP